VFYDEQQRGRHVSERLWAFNTREAQRLTGLSARRLQYWDETDFIRPSVAARQGRGWPRLYAFQDIVQLRIAAMLRDRLSLQALRRLKSILDVDAPFATLRFAVVPGTNELVYLGPTGQPEAARAPGQIVMTFEVPLEEIRSDLVERVHDIRARSGSGELTGRPGTTTAQKLAGTRITVRAVERALAAGWDDERLLTEFPGLTEDDLGAVRERQKQRRAG
jgi:DNA-binding transcriptional MerR regulator